MQKAFPHAPSVTYRECWRKMLVHILGMDNTVVIEKPFDRSTIWMGEQSEDDVQSQNFLILRDVQYTKGHEVAQHLDRKRPRGPEPISD